MSARGSEEASYDLAIVGSGAAAFAAALAAHRLDLSVVMVERATVGGTCVNTGCVPSKALIAAADARHTAQVADRFPGISSTLSAVSFPALLAGKRHLVDAMRAEKYTDLTAEYGWQLLSGTARFVGDAAHPSLQVHLDDGEMTAVDAAHYLVATGSTPAAPPVDGLAEAGYLTSTSAMELTELPRSMVVLGGNAVGLEQAQLFARLGTEVTVIEALDRLAPRDEPEISDALRSVFTGEGIEVRTGASLTAVARDGSGYRLTYDDAGRTAHTVEADQLLVATGRRPDTGDLGLDRVGVCLGRSGEVVVDGELRTANPRIWAAGDVAGAPQLVYAAGAQGSAAVRNAFEHAGHVLDYEHLPMVTFTAPAVASVGLTERQAEERGHRSDCRVLPLSSVPRALVDRDTRGLVKLVADADTGRLLGAHLLAHGAGDVIAGAVHALANRMTVTQLAEQWCPYLTMAEALKLAAVTYTRDVTKLSCCAS